MQRLDTVKPSARLSIRLGALPRERALEDPEMGSAEPDEIFEALDGGEFEAMNCEADGKIDTCECGG